MTRRWCSLRNLSASSWSRIAWPKIVTVKTSAGCLFVRPVPAVLTFCWRALQRRRRAAVSETRQAVACFHFCTRMISGDYRTMMARGVKFKEEPREESYGTVAVFEDLYGNKWDLLELKPTAKSP